MSNCKIKTSKQLNEVEKTMLTSFIKFCKEKLEIETMPPRITIFEGANSGMTTGGYQPTTKEITVLGGNRMFVDVLRTIAHELTHHKQNERGTLFELMQEYPEDLYSPYENEAYEKSGNIVKEWCRTARKNKTFPVELYSVYY